MLAPVADRGVTAPLLEQLAQAIGRRSKDLLIGSTDPDAEIQAALHYPADAPLPPAGLSYRSGDPDRLRREAVQLVREARGRLRALRVELEQLGHEAATLATILGDTR